MPATDHKSRILRARLEHHENDAFAESPHHAAADHNHNQDDCDGSDEERGKYYVTGKSGKYTRKNMFTHSLQYS